jgi:transposase
MADVNFPPRYDASDSDAAHPRSADLPALAEVRDAARAMWADGAQDQALDFVLAALGAVLKKSRELELLIAKLRRAGRSSERLDPEQLALLFAELAEQQQGRDGAPSFDPEAEEREDAQLERELEETKREAEASGKTKLEPKRGWRTRGVVREVHQGALPPEERTCAHCGAAKRKIGTEVSRELHYVPGHFVEREYHREKWACTHCKWGVTTAPAPAKVIPRSAATPSLLAHVVVSKYVDHTPLHRLHRIYDRSGATIPVSTLADWVGSVADRVQPLVARLAERIVRDAYVVGTDATGLRVLDPTSPDNIQWGTIWCVVGDETDVVFHYTPTGEGEPGPWTFLAGRRGYLQADAANVFDRLYNGQVASAIEVGCWSHGRRRFVALQDTDPRVAYPLMLIRRLYRHERLADLKKLTPEQRRDLRRERSAPVLDTLKPWLILMVADEPPSSDFARACGYLLNHWDALTRFLDDGRLRLDNNLTELQIRDVATGRKNYLFAGSHEAAHRTAVLYSLMRTAGLHGVAPLPYLSDVLTKLAAGWDPDRLDELLPGRWASGNGPP